LKYLEPHKGLNYRNFPFGFHVLLQKPMCIT
jgi:hypothetical protein